MKDREFDWSCEESATKHGFSKEEIQSAFSGRKFVKALDEDAYMLLGRSEDGHLLEIFYRITSEGKIKVFHCMTMRERFRKLFKKRAK
jgi:uncharacterized DUF497 family protein